MPQSHTQRSFTTGWERTTNLTTGAVTERLFPDELASENYRSFTGSKVSNYRTFRKTNGYLPTLSASDLIIQRRTGNARQVNFAYSNGVPVSMLERYHPSCKSVTVPSTSVTDSIFSSLLNEAWSKTRRKVLDQDFNAPVFLAEGAKTVNMIADRAHRLARAYSSFRKGRLNDVAVQLGFHKRNSHNTWLEYKYGWMPLLSDIHGGAKTLAELNFKRDQFTSRSTATYRLPRVSDSQPGSWYLTAKTWVTVRTRNPSVQAANRVGALNPLLVAWELVPFSFVADWFVNIGDCIAEVSAFAGVTILSGGSSKTLEWSGTISDSNYVGYNAPLSTIAKYRKYTRTPGVQTMPRLQIKSNPLSIEKIVTAGALLRQSVRKAPLPSKDRAPQRDWREQFPEGYAHL